MNGRYSNDPFTSIKMPPEVLDLLRRLNAIERSSDTLQVLQAS
ncbi:hypothetical protein [Pseudomonas sp. ESBL9]